MTVSKILLSLLGVFIASQFAYGEYSRHIGPFAYFQENHSTRDFAAINGIIDNHFLTPRSVEETQTYLSNASFECRDFLRHQAELWKGETAEQAAKRKSGSLFCFYSFGGWLPTPDTWMIRVQFGEDGLSEGVSRQRIAK